MEDMARLALVEQSVRDTDKFSEIMYEVLRHINNILENPHDYEIRTIQSAVLKKCLEFEAFVDYMKYVGFQAIAETLTYPKEYSLSKLRIAQVTIERKLSFCSGPLDHSRIRVRPTRSTLQTKKTKLIPANILKTNSPLLLKIQSLFNHMIKYEDEELQELARSHIPIVTLQLAAIDRLREHQRKLKSGEIKGRDLPFDIALLMELIGWFKYKFFSWMDRPRCKSCGPGSDTSLVGTSTITTDTETCRLEMYKCTRCGARVDFPRYNDPRALLKSRTGRCGEWANCFVLLSRSLGYDTRHVYDTTDHVWSEVFDWESGRWLHVDPCEGRLDAPLLYSSGWNKQLAYVIATCRHDLQDVTWRYTCHHSQVLKRRTMCSEAELIESILLLRDHRQRQLSAARRHYLARRAVQELAELMVEKTPSDDECQGRISGSKEWRTERGEIGTEGGGHTFECREPGVHHVRYYPAADLYRAGRAEAEREVAGWRTGSFRVKNIFRKEELDWRMVYLAREERAAEGSISWRVSAAEGAVCSVLSVSAESTEFESGRVLWTIAFDDEEAVAVDFKGGQLTWRREFSSAVVSAALAGGEGALGWQQAQLFRHKADSRACGLHILATVTKKE